MPTVNIALENLPSALQSYGDQTGFAASVAINKTLFERRLKLIANNHFGQLRINRKAWMRRTMRVQRSTKYDLCGSLGHTQEAWYMALQVAGGTRRATHTWTKNGKTFKHLIVPNKKYRGGKLQKAMERAKDAKKGPFVIENEDGDLLLVRRVRKTKNSPLETLAFLVTNTQYRPNRLRWKKSMFDIERDFAVHYRVAMRKAAAKAR